MASASAQKMGGNLASQWRSKNAAQCKRISQAIAKNFELQSLALSTIENYQIVSLTAQEAGKSLAETVKTKQKRGEGSKIEISQPGSWLRARCVQYGCFHQQGHIPAVLFGVESERANAGSNFRHQNDKAGPVSKLKEVPQHFGAKLMRVIPKITRQGTVPWGEVGVHKLTQDIANEVWVVKLYCCPLAKEVTVQHKQSYFGHIE
eukprot:6488194-Amphidinium_carterae.1